MPSANEHDIRLCSKYGNDIRSIITIDNRYVLEQMMTDIDDNIFVVLRTRFHSVYILWVISKDGNIVNTYEFHESIEILSVDKGEILLYKNSGQLTWL